MTAHIHLTDAQFTDLLSGTETPDVLHHVQGCVVCGAELERVRSAVESFNGLSLLWAQREAGRIQTPAVPERRWSIAPTWSMAGGLAVVLVVAGLAAEVHLERLHQEAAPAVEMAAAPTEAAVSEDNRLMAAIDNELHQPVTAAIPVEELDSAQGRSRQSATRRTD